MVVCFLNLEEKLVFLIGFITGLAVAFIGSTVLSIFIMSWLRFQPRVTKETKRRFYPRQTASEEKNNI
ncbi:hypothetical protein BWI75_22330 [Gloeocapsopsis sp. AAB1 = 1H9]|uniref:Uncharacterized protein n=2 Tax=Gloeocapsopsis TaxID=693222 RepID=A0A6N8G477_9CHRO|nr:hypothetical protein [Gloeocapsopsis dulcis AAB1 = 1H9]